MWKLNVLPSPTALVTVISPPISCTYLRLIAKPSPVPCCEFLPASVCPKASNNTHNSSLQMPIPVSSTSKMRDEEVRKDEGDEEGSCFIGEGFWNFEFCGKWAVSV